MLFPLARRAPQYTKSSNAVEDTLRKQRDDISVHIVDVLGKSGQLINPLHSHMGVQMKDMEAKSGEDEWLPVIAVAHMDEEWILQWLDQHSNSSFEELSAPTISGSMSFQHLLTFGLQLPAQVNLSLEMIFKLICWAVFAARHEQAGSRLRTLNRTCLGPGGEIRWAQGCYSLYFDHGQANLIN